MLGVNTNDPREGSIKLIHNTLPLSPYDLETQQIIIQLSFIWLLNKHKDFFVLSEFPREK